MKGSSLILSSTILSYASCLKLNKRNNPTVVSVDFEKRTKDVSFPHGKRDNDDIVEMKLSAEIDPGSADLLLLTNEIETCKKRDCQGGVYNPEKSETFEWDEEQVSGSFGSGESWEGIYANDTSFLESVELDSFQFVGTTEFNTTTAGIFSIFGVGLYSLEHAEIKYPNLPYALADAGEINTPAFNLWFNNETHGEFLFGGVNKAKYTGPLVT
ncbi:hypothetical protein IL306_004628 [Fusarium sp. DS 682]|nr:hypothetical protein IL306_004628 [Fusarium sp. DS 682]